MSETKEQILEKFGEGAPESDCFWCEHKNTAHTMEYMTGHIVVKCNDCGCKNSIRNSA